MRLLLIEDNARLSDLIDAGLRREGLSVDRVTSVDDARSALATTQFAAIILDLGLPDGDGLSVIQELRGRGGTIPILILTARQSVRDKVKGLELGADDYLGKPFAFEELVARVRALLRRPAAYLGRELTLGRIVFDTAGREVLLDGRPLAMGPRETTLLEALLRRAGHVVSKKALEDLLYGLSDEGSTNAVEVTIHRLRKQLDDVGADITVHTVRGVGYLIRQETA